MTKYDRPTVKGKTHPIGRNGPCPCGSGRKFKHCCGGGPRQSATKPRDGLNIGPLTEVAKLREAADRFRDVRSAPPAGGLAETEARRAIDRSTPEQSRLIEAERHRQLGMGLFETGKFAAATAALRRATDLAPRDAGSHHLLGRALLRAGDLGGAVDSLRLAIALKDDFAAAHLDLALALAATGRDREARAMCGRAIELAPEMAEGHRLLSELLEAAGASYEAADYSRRAAALGEDSVSDNSDFVKAAVLENNLAAAERSLREAIARHPNSHELHKALGDVLAKRGRFEEAIEACDRALVLNPLYAPAHLAAVQVRKCGEADRPRLTRMRSALREPSLDDEGRLFLHFAIGKLLDDIGQYREAMRHFDRGNSIRHRNARFDRAGLADVIDRLIARYKAAFFEANREFGLADETPLFIVGMPRSGTTLVEQIVEPSCG